MTTPLDDDLKKLLVGTNDQRRRVGQALHHFYRTLVFWHAHDRTFLETTKSWAAGGGAIFSSLATSLAEFGTQERDETLREFLGEVLRQLAGDLERGDHMLVPFLRWIETRFPALTVMMQEESPDSRIYDAKLAEVVSHMFFVATQSDRPDLVGSLRDTAGRIVAAG